LSRGQHLRHLLKFVNRGTLQVFCASSLILYQIPTSRRKHRRNQARCSPLASVRQEKTALKFLLRHVPDHLCDSQAGEEDASPGVQG
jgi:hypothetical protein